MLQAQAFVQIQGTQKTGKDRHGITMDVPCYRQNIRVFGAPKRARISQGIAFYTAFTVNGPRYQTWAGILFDTYHFRSRA